MLFSCCSWTLDEAAATLEAPSHYHDEEDDIRGEKIQEIHSPPTDGQDTDEDCDEDLQEIIKIPAIDGQETDEHCDEENEGSKRNWKFNANFGGYYVQDIDLSDFNERSDRLTPMNCFKSLYNADIIKFLVYMSNQYALQNNHVLSATCREMRVYIAVLLLTGYLSPKNIGMFWESKSDVHNELVSKSITWCRFLEIHKYLHTCNNFNLPQGDTFGKLRRYFDMLNKSFGNNSKYLLTSNISIGETVVPYYGSHGSKQHMHGKPIRFGYRMWSACTPTGYLIHFIPDQGSEASPLPTQRTLGLGAAVVLNLLAELPKEIEHYSLYFDSYFTSLPLLDILLAKGHAGTGRIRESRTEQCPLRGSEAMKKMARGSMSMTASDDIAVVQWHDNSIITVASTSHGLDPVSEVERIRIVNKKRVKIRVPCPKAVSVYNRFVGGVDRFEADLHSQRIACRGKKWWFCLFAFGLDAACHNAWKVHQARGGTNMTYCDFRRSVVQGYLGTYKRSMKKHPSSGSVKATVHKECKGQKDLEEHTREQCRSSRCVSCHEPAGTRCRKCRVALHVQCWNAFHAK